MSRASTRAVASIPVDMVSFYSDGYAPSREALEIALGPLEEIEHADSLVLPAGVVVVKRLVRELASARGVDEDTVLMHLREWVEIDFSDDELAP